MLKHVLVIAALAACGKDKGDKPAGGGEESSGPLVMSAADLWTDYNKPRDGMALLERYRPGVIVNGTVTRVLDEGGKTTLYFEPAPKKLMSLAFADAKGKKQGDAVTAQCKVGGATDNLMMLLDCVAK
jgi:hypothetical protein